MDDAQVALHDRGEVCEVGVERLDHRGRSPPSGGRRRPMRPRGPQSGLVDVAGDRDLDRRRARDGVRRDRFVPVGPGCRRRAPARARRRRAGGSPGPGPDRRRRRWSRCRRCPRSRAAPRRRWPPEATRPCLGWSRSRGCADRTERAPAPKPMPSRARRCDRRRAGRTEPRSAHPAARDRALRGNEPPVAATRASTVPSPPSAIGTRSIVASAQPATTPRAMACRGLRRRQASLELVRGDHHPHRCRANPDAGARTRPAEPSSRLVAQRASRALVTSMRA